MTGQGGATAPVAVQRTHHKISPLGSLLQFLLLAATVPYRRAFKLYTWKPIQDVRAANGDRKLLIPLIKNWKTDKYAEFKSVQVAVSQLRVLITKMQPIRGVLTSMIQATFCGGAVFSSLPLSRSENAIWIVSALWYCSLVCSIFAIVTSIQTTSMVDDLPSREQLNETLPEMDVQRMQRTILRYKKTPGIKHWIMMFIWQFPSMTMAYAWCTYVAGLTVFLCSPFIKKLPWQDQHKIAIAYLSFVFIGLVTYVSATIFVYSGEKDYERSAANSCASTLSSTRSDTLSDRDNDSNEREAGMTSNQTGALAKPKESLKSSTVVDRGCPVQAVREKMVVGFQKSDAPAGDTGKLKRSLLY